MLFTAQENAQLWNLTCDMSEALDIFKRYEKVSGFTDDQATAQFHAFKALKQAIDAIDDTLLKCCECSLH